MLPLSSSVRRFVPADGSARLKIVQAKNRLAGLLAEHGSKDDALPCAVRVMEWSNFALESVLAANLPDNDPWKFTRAKMQLSGHAIECAFKAFILASGEEPRVTHDLAWLCERAEQMGCCVTEHQALVILQVSIHYFVDLGTGTKYKARYPPPTVEFSKAPIPPHRLIQGLVESVTKQANTRAENCV